MLKSVVIYTISFAVCDDEPVMAGEISELISGYMRRHKGTPFSVSSFSSGSALLKSSGAFDVVFLDVQMDGPDGMDTARLLRRRGDTALLIFVTVLKERVFDAFQVEAFDYLIKPISSESFYGTMDRAMGALEHKASKSIIVRRGSGCEIVPLSEIVYCEVLGRKIYIHRSDGTVIDYYEKIGELEQRVDGRFFKCHRSYLVNLAYVRGCRSGRIILPNEQTIPVSRLRESELTAALLRYMKEAER